MFFAKVEILNLFKSTKKKKIVQKIRASVVARLKKDYIDTEHDHNLLRLVEKMSQLCTT